MTWCLTLALLLYGTSEELSKVANQDYQVWKQAKLAVIQARELYLNGSCDEEGLAEKKDSAG
jgi:hypothetical protein